MIAHSFNYSFILFVCLFAHLYLLIHSLAHPFIYLLTHYLTHSPIHSFIHLFIEYFTISSFIQPENIVLKEEKSPQIKLIDFGLARKLSQGEMVREIMGTPEFVGKASMDIGCSFCVILTQLSYSLKLIETKLILFSDIIYVHMY